MNLRLDYSLYNFFTFLAAALFIFTVIYGSSEFTPSVDESVKVKKPYILAVLVIILSISAYVARFHGMGNFLVIFKMLAKPFASTTSAIITQVLLIFTTIIFIIKKAEKSAAEMGIFIFSALFAVGFSSRMFMIHTRPAVNTYIVTAILVAAVLCLAIMLLINRKPEFRILYKVLSILLGLQILLVIGFTYRLTTLDIPDRALTAARLINGDMAGIYWAMAVFLLVVPLILSILLINCGNTKRHRLLASVMAGSYTVGATLLFIILNRAPLLQGGLNGRIFMP
jgi:hypothetical protein